MNAIFLSTLVFLAADVYTTQFEEGVAHYQAGRFAEAARAFEHVAASQAAGPAVYYNLGNAYFRMAQLGRAIACYERALREAPRLGPARENRDHALAQTRRKLAAPLAPAWEQALLFWDDALSAGESRLLAFLAWFAAWALLALRLWRRLPYLRIVAAAFFVFGLLFGLSAWTKARPAPLAVAVVPQLAVRFGPGENETVRFELFEGDRVLVEARQGDWMRVCTVDGERGWAPAALFATVDTPLAPAAGPAAAPKAPA
jgi:hypothetical protein